MSKLRIISLIVLIIAFFVTIDLGFNYLQAVTANISGTGDGITIHSAIARLFIGDRLWSYQKYFNIFQTCAWITFAVMLENAVLGIISIIHTQKQGR